MDDPDGDWILEDGGVNGDGAAVGDDMAVGDLEGEVAAAMDGGGRGRRPNFRNQFRTPQVLLTGTQVAVEAEMESTASSPQPPLPGGIGSSSGGRNGTDTVTGEPRAATARKTPSPVKLKKRNARVKRRTSKTTSDVWEYFTQEDTDAGPIAICKFCDQVYQCERGFHGTSTLRSHLLYRCPTCPFTDHERRRKSVKDDHKFNVGDCRRALAKMIITDEYPFSAVEGEGFREYSRTLQPKFEPPSRYTVARDCVKLYLEEKEKLKEVLKNQRVCLTTDTWTSVQNQNYMSLTAHWINKAKCAFTSLPHSRVQSDLSCSLTFLQQSGVLENSFLQLKPGYCLHC